jgi:hypothetical protein
MDISSLKAWWNSAENLSNPGLFFFRETFIAASVSLYVIDLFRWSIPLGSVLY